MHATYILCHSRRFNRSLHRWLLDRGWYIWNMFSTLGTGSPKMCGDRFCPKLKKCNFMIRERVVPCQKVSQKGLEVDKENIEVIEKLKLEFRWREFINFEPFQVLLEAHQRLLKNCTPSIQNMGKDGEIQL